MDVAVLVPVKDFRQAKVRLAGALAPWERAALARSMASNVVAAADSLPVFVVCDDGEVAAWAEAAAPPCCGGLAWVSTALSPTASRRSGVRAWAG